MNWQLLPQFAITGFLNGGPIALIALGIVLIFKSSEIFNFSQGQMLLIGTLSTWWFWAEEGLGLPLWAAVILGITVSAVLGLLIERFALRPMTGQPLLSIILMTLALSQFLQGMAILVFGTTQRNFPAIFEVTSPYKLTIPFLTYNDNPIIVILQNESPFGVMDTGNNNMAPFNESHASSGFKMHTVFYEIRYPRSCRVDNGASIDSLSGF